MFGYGFSEDLLRATLDEMTTDSSVPTAIIMDSGSTDSGPSKLATGSKTCPDASYRKDFEKVVRAALEFGVPVLISSAGGDGSNEHVDEFVEMVREAATLVGR